MIKTVKIKNFVARFATMFATRFEASSINMSRALELIVKDKNNCIINGLLTRTYITEIIKLGDDFITNASNPRVSFSDIKSCDSSGIALIIHWWRLATQQEKEITFNNISEDMLSIIYISNLDNLFAV
jgi:ABC-type transporter Mla MlaB component